MQACASAAARGQCCPAARRGPTAGSVEEMGQVSCRQGQIMSLWVEVQEVLACFY